MADETDRVVCSEISVAVNTDTLVTWFADLVQVEADRESVSINVAQKVPGIGQGIDCGNTPQAMLVGRIILSWPHFARLASILPRVLDDHRNIAKQALEEALD